MKENIEKIVIWPVGQTVRMEVFYKTHSLVLTDIFQKQAIMKIKDMFKQVKGANK